jgi:hypothetical protein
VTNWVNKLTITRIISEFKFAINLDDMITNSFSCTFPNRTSEEYDNEIFYNVAVFV